MAQTNFRRIGVVVPASQAAAELGACLGALLQAGFANADILVVDDAATDATGDIARTNGVHVLRNEVAARPARARNAGVAALDCEIVLFVDSDVVVHDDIREYLLAHFEATPDLTAVFGAYDTAPPAPATVSRYRNLLHHYTHFTAAGDVETFWTGLGAVRRSAFLEVGGLDPDWENIEDVEFGLRLSSTGRRIRLDPAIQGTHLKAWTLRSMFRTDLRGRAMPWARLLALKAAQPGTLNTSRRHQLAAGAVLAFIVSSIATVFWPPAGLGVLLACSLFLAASAPFLAFLNRVHGPLFALRAIPCHALHYVAGLTGYIWVCFYERPRRGRPGRSTRPT